MHWRTKRLDRTASGHDHDKPYRIDYCFASSNFEAKDVEIKNFGNWSKKVTICHL
jgi:hypothetical protein